MNWEALFTFLQTWYGFVASIIAIATPPFFLGLYIGSRKQKSRQQPPSQYDQIKEAKKRFRSKIEWIEEMKSDLNYKINLRKTSGQAQKTYQSLIDELDIEKRELERSIASLSEEKENIGRHD